MPKIHKHILEASYRGGDFQYYYHYPTRWWAQLYAWYWTDREITFRYRQGREQMSEQEGFTKDGIVYYPTEAVGELCAMHRKFERERIIALLESIKPGCECNDCEKPAEEARTYLDHIIALIKGENNE